jgi:hypothetical protein
VSEDGEIYFFHEDTGAVTWDRPGSDSSIAPVEATAQAASADSAVVVQRDAPAAMSTLAPVESDSDAVAAPLRVAPPVEEVAAKHSSAPSVQAAETVSGADMQAYQYALAEHKALVDLGTVLQNLEISRF